MELLRWLNRLHNTCVIITDTDAKCCINVVLFSLYKSLIYKNYLQGHKNRDCMFLSCHVRVSE